ncbi:pre-mycofactocin synthase MftD [Salinibacterium sp. ZJ454]|uniref:pre-mycofactocin synthase MftD n=1 Tax=Salinibacterium sp. ZJ454 TaxID=2708339 RepID=UPI001422DE4C|nr:pre-mycofactocin synthase MftD [Salinibacterium sp. ZJ454]
MATKPIESVADAQRRAKKRVPAPIYTALISGNEKGVTMDANVDAFSEIGWRPLVARETHEEQPIVRDLSSSALGMDLSVPFMIGPAGAQAVDPHAEVSVAKAAKTAGTAIGLSSFATKPFEEVIAVNENALYQLYWTGSRDQILWRTERAKAAGAKGLIVTLDATGGGLGRRDWDSPYVPPKIDLATMIRSAPMGLSRPGWLARFVFGGGIPNLTVPNSANGPGRDPSFGEIYGGLMQTQVPTWDDVQWLREEWGGKFVVKGLFRSDEARRAIDIGADAIVVSNHGGNNLDSTYASIRVLPAIAEAIGDQAEVWFDGGIRRGMDVAKALALGADTVLLGRAWLWGLAAGGEQGVLDILRMMESGLERTLVGLGHKSVKDLSPDDITAPEGFFIKG